MYNLLGKCLQNYVHLNFFIFVVLTLRPDTDLDFEELERIERLKILRNLVL